MKRIITLCLTAALLASMISGCGSTQPAQSETPTASQSTSASTDAKQPAATGETITFGLGCPITGPSASYGELMQIGAQIAVDEINAAGGIDGKQVVLKVLDDKNDPKEAALVAQRFCDDPEIFAVISHGGSSPTMAAAPIYEKAKMSNMAPSSSNHTLTELGYEYFVRHVIRDDRQGPQVIALMGNNLNIKDIAIVYGNNDYGRGSLEYAKTAAEQLGMNVVAAETYNPGVDKDFTTLLTKIQRSGAKGVAIYADYNDAGLILGQAKNIPGMEDMVWVGQSALTYKKLVELATPEALQNVYILVTFNPYATDRPAVANFMKLFAERKDGIPSEPCGFSYDIVQVFKQAIEQGATKDNLAQFIKNKVPGQPQFTAKSILLGDSVVWDQFGDVEPRGVDVLRVDESGEFVTSDMKVDITGLTMAGVVAS